MCVQWPHRAAYIRAAAKRMRAELTLARPALMRPSLVAGSAVAGASAVVLYTADKHRPSPNDISNDSRPCVKAKLADHRCCGRQQCTHVRSTCCRHTLQQMRHAFASYHAGTNAGKPKRAWAQRPHPPRKPPHISTPTCWVYHHCWCCCWPQHHWQ